MERSLSEILEDIRDYDAAVRALETGKRTGTAEVLSTIAGELNLDIDDLVR